MADVAGYNTVVYGNGYDLTGNYRSFSLSITRGVGDNTSFSAVSRTRIFTGAQEGTLSLDGFFDAAAGQEDAVWQIPAAGGDNMIVVPEGSTEGNWGYALQSVKAQRNITGRFDSIVTGTIELPSTGGVHRVNLMHALAAETSTGTGTVLDNGASFTGGGAAYLMVTASGGSWGTFDLDVEHSADNSTFANLASFTQVAADNAHEQITWTATTNRYLRLSWTLATVTSVTFVCGVHRNNT